jgi:hypothetical protein
VEVRQIVAELDHEIARLKEARALLAGWAPAKGKRGVSAGAPTGKKRQLSPEARKRISEAQQRRWAAQKKAAK